jgi:aminoglycoside 6'-N-acetyltransferase I
MNTVERRVRAVINPWSTAFARWWCHSATRFTLTGYGAPRRRVLGGDRDLVRPTPAGAPPDGMPQAVRIEPLASADVASAVALAVRVLRVRPGDRGEQFAADITDARRQMYVAKADGQVVGCGRVIELAAGEAGPETPAGCYLSGVLVDPAWRGRGVATALTRARLRWAFARTGTVFYVAGAGHAASLRLHAALGFQEVGRFGSDRSPAGVDVLSQLVRSTAPDGPGPLEAQPH